MGPDNTGPNQFLSPKQNEEQQRIEDGKMMKVQEEHIKRLEGIAVQVINILKKESVTIKEWAQVVAAVDLKTNVRINDAQFSQILKL